MKLRIVLASIAWTLVITALHLWANVGFSAAAADLRAWLGLERPNLRVAFLPVT